MANLSPWYLVRCCGVTVNWYIRLLHRRVTLVMFFAGASLLGALTLARLPVELLPAQDTRLLTLFTSVRGGLPPEAVEQQITRLIEEAVSQVSHVRSLLSRSEEGRSTVQLQFHATADMDVASATVRHTLDRLQSQLPPETEPPIVARFRQDDAPVMIVAIQQTPYQVPKGQVGHRRRILLQPVPLVPGTVHTLEHVRALVERELKPALSRVPGVAKIDIAGGREEKIRVDLSEARLRAHTMAATRVTNLLGMSHVTTYAGDQAQRTQTLRTRMVGEFQSTEEMARLGIARSRAGSLVRLQDLATVHQGYLEPRTLSRVNGQAVVSCYVQQESQANTLRVADGVEQTLTMWQAQHPAWHLQILHNQADTIRVAMAGVRNSLLWGALLAALVLWWFLRDRRQTLLIVIMLPIAVLIACLLLGLTRLTLNVMTLSGLALGIGMLLDTGIVVLESLTPYQVPKGQVGNRRILLQPVPLVPGTVLGVRTVAGPLIASTLTTVAVFVPLLFAPHELRSQYGPLGLAVTFTLLAALLVAFLLLPMLATTSGSSVHNTTAHEPARLRHLRRWHAVCLRKALRHPRRWLIGAGVAFVVTLWLAPRLGLDIASAAQARTITAHVQMQSGTQLAVTAQAVQRVENIVQEQRGIRTINSHIEPDSAKVYVTLTPSRWRSIQRLTDRLRPTLNDAVQAFGAEHFVYFASGGLAGKKELTADLVGPDYPVLLDLARQLTEPLTHTGRFADARLRYRPGRPEWQLIVDYDRAAAYGLATADIAEQLHAKVRGLRATLFYQEGKDLEVVTRLQADDRATIEQIAQLSLMTPAGHLVRVAQVTSPVEATGPSEIWRQNKARLIQLTAAVRRGTLSGAATAVRQAIAQLELPDGYAVRLNESYTRVTDQRWHALVACGVMVVLMWMLLAGLYESHRAALLILVTLPLALVGVVFVLWFFRQPWTLGALAGCLMLGGIVVNNGILLLAAMETLRASGLPLEEAIMRATQDRFRPILMTTATTIVGMLPLLFTSGEAAALWQPLALVLITGLTVSTVLTLIILPCAYHNNSTGSD